MHYQVQDAMLQGMWSREVLALPKCGAAGGANSEILWYGPRVRMGMYGRFICCLSECKHALSSTSTFPCRSSTASCILSQGIVVMPWQQLTMRNLLTS